MESKTLKNTRQGSLPGNGSGGSIVAIKHPSPGSFIMKTHGLYKHKLYKVWITIKQKCNNPKSSRYRWYGARGISVCPLWRDNFISFYEHVMALPNAMSPGYSIDRIDNDGNYEPGNIRWATQSIQMTNSRMRVDNKSGFAGIFYISLKRKYIAYIYHHKKMRHIGWYDDIETAVNARNEYIKAHKLPHKLQKYVK
jgi:hypothetical protein